MSLLKFKKEHFKNVLYFLLTLYILFVLTSCQNNTSANTTKQTISFFPTWDTIIEANIEKSFSFMISTKAQKIQNINYLQALSQQDLQQVKNMARNYYENEFLYDLLSLKVAENDCHWYNEYPQYPAGNIIVFQAETTHSGEGIYRYITFVKNNDTEQWTQINEGY